MRPPGCTKSGGGVHHPFRQGGFFEAAALLFPPSERVFQGAADAKTCRLDRSFWESAEMFKKPLMILTAASLLASASAEAVWAQSYGGRGSYGDGYTDGYRAGWDDFRMK